MEQARPARDREQDEVQAEPVVEDEDEWAEIGLEPESAENVFAQHVEPQLRIKLVFLVIPSRVRNAV